MKRRLISIIMIVCMLVTMLPNTAAAGIEPYVASGATAQTTEPVSNPFKDVSPSDWFYQSVMDAVSRGIFQGTGETSFTPDGTLTRGMYVTVLGRIAGINPADYKADNHFLDVDPNAYFAPYVAWASKMGITLGLGHNKFVPEGIVSREQMAVFTLRYFDAYGIKFSAADVVDTTPKDLSKVADWAQDAVLKLWKAGLLKGDEFGNINPTNHATRAEAASFTVQTDNVVENWLFQTNAASTKPTEKPTFNSPLVQYRVTFNTNGGSTIPTMYVSNGNVISDLPTPQKDNAIFMGWYRDPGLQEPQFTSSDSVTSEITLYAKYLTIQDTPAAEVDDTYALMDQNTNLTFTIHSKDLAMDGDTVKSKLSLSVMDGSQVSALNVVGSNGVYTVSTAEEFSAGASYLLTLLDSDLTFDAQGDNIRNCSFSIKRAESFEIELNDGLIYIPNEQISNIIKNGEHVTALSVPVVAVGEDGTSSGSFIYSGGLALKVGDLLCVYSGARPTVGDDSAFVGDDIAYINVSGVNGTTITYGNADATEVIKLPDVLPMSVGAGTELSGYDVNENPGSFTVPLSALDFSAYSDMNLDATTTVDEGDYIAFYSSATLQEAGEEDVMYGIVTSIISDGTTVSIGYTPTTAEVMQNSMGYYSSNDVSSETMLEGVDIAAVEDEIRQQLIDSNFAQRAAVYMTGLATETDSFQALAGEGFELQPMGDTVNGAPDISNLKFKVSINNNTQKLSKGVRCAVEVTFDVPIEVGENNEIKISLKATFVEELNMSVKATGDTVWKKKWIFPYIADYTMTSKIDVYNFTGISFKSTISSGSDTQKIDISQEMQDIIASTDTSDIKAGVEDLFDVYGTMMDNDTDWINLIEQNIAENKMSVLLGIIQIKVSATFVVAVNINVALGLNFEYQSGTRYIFWAKMKAKDAGSETVDLMDEVYTFQFYVMGALGLRAGINIEFAVGLFSTDLNSIGLTAEAGVYARIYGFFFYELKSVNGNKTSKKSGALYMELGIYLEIAFKAQVLNGKFQYNPTLYENEWPLLTAGERYNVYDFSYADNSEIKLKDTVKTYAIPTNMFSMTYLDLREGDVSNKTYTSDKYTISFSNSAYSLNGNTVTLNVPTGSHYQATDMTITWKSGSLAFTSVPITRTVHLVWDDLNANGYTLTFNSNGGSWVNSINKLYGATLTAPTAPTKVGYTFAGWYKDAQLTQPYAFTSMDAVNLTLFAKWTPNGNTIYKVNHYVQDLANSTKYTLQESQSLSGTTATNVTPGTKNYVGFTAPSTQTATIAADGSLVVTYQYARNNYTLLFNANGGEGGTSTSVKYGATVTAPTVTKTGYLFDGWTPTLTNTMAAGNATYTAQWKVKKFVVSFDSNGGTAANTIEVAYGNTYGTLPTPTRSGYTFDGWYTSETANNGMGSQVTSGTVAMMQNAQTLFAKWIASGNTNYTVKHYQQNISNAEYTLVATVTLQGTTDATVIPVPNTYSGFTTPVPSSAVIADDGSTIVTYYYARNSYQLNFNANGGIGGTSAQVKYGANLTPPTVTKAGFTLSGWSPSVAATMPAVNTTYTAQWNVLTYPVTFDSNSGTTCNAINVEAGQTYGTLPTPTRTGYVFGGWYVSETNNNGTGDVVTSNTVANISAPQILFAKWTVANNTIYTVKHYQQNIANDEYTLFATEQLQGTTGATVTPDTKVYTGFTAPSTATVVILADGSAELSYNYQRNTALLTFDADGGIGGTSGQVKFGTSLTPPTVTKAGYTLSGWSPSVAATMPASDVTYTAQWSAATDTIYTVKHYQQNIANDEYTLFATEQLQGTTGATVTPDTKVYTGFTAPSTATVTILADGSAELTYNYQRNTYLLTYDANGGVGGTSGQVKFGTSLTPPTVTKAGYTFAGWSPSVPATMPASNVTYTAQFPSETSVSTLAQLVTALADGNVSTIIVTQVIPLTNGTNLVGNNKVISAQITGVDTNGNIQAGSNYSIFTIANGSTVSITDLTIKGGSASAIVNSGLLTMNHVTITQSGNASISGGALNNSNKVILKDCALVNNVAQNGGGILNSSSATVILDRSSVTGNRSLGTSAGGGGTENQGIMVINNSTYANNTGSEIGGAINNYMGTIYLMNSSIIGNRVITNNGFVCGGGIGNNSGTVHIMNSIVVNNYENHANAGYYPSDIGVYSSETNIKIYNSYVGAYVKSLTGNIATTGAPTYSTNSTVNPVGNGLAGIFANYETVSSVSIPVLSQLSNGSYSALLVAGSPALTGGCDTYLDYTINSISQLGYGTTPTYLIGTSGTKVTDLQNGSARASGVVGAMEQ